MPALPAFGGTEDVQVPFAHEGQKPDCEATYASLPKNTPRKTHSRWMSNEAHGPNALQGHVKSKTQFPSQRQPWRNDNRHDTRRHDTASNNVIRIQEKKGCSHCSL